MNKLTCSAYRSRVCFLSFYNRYNSSVLQYSYCLVNIGTSYICDNKISRLRVALGRTVPLASRQFVRASRSGPYWNSELLVSTVARWVGGSVARWVGAVHTAHCTGQAQCWTLDSGPTTFVKTNHIYWLYQICLLYILYLLVILI